MSSVAVAVDASVVAIRFSAARLFIVPSVLSLDFKPSPFVSIVYPFLLIKFT